MVHAVYNIALFLSYAGLWLLPPMLLLSVFPRMRKFGGRAIVGISYGWGFAAWFIAALVLFSLWGAVGAILGLLLTPFGAIPLAIIASLIHGDYKGTGFFLLILAGILVVRGLGYWIDSKAPASDGKGSLAARVGR